MDFNTFQNVISKERLKRYVDACDGNKRKGITLYRYNLSLSSEMLKIISCFEVALRNRIDKTLVPILGRDWLRDSCLAGGIFDNPKTNSTKTIICKAYNGLLKEGLYTPTKLMAEMEFGVWKYMFSGPQYYATGQNLLTIFPKKPKSTPFLSIDNKHIFNELDRINQIRNRIAHHEPICFMTHLPKKSVTYAQNEYSRILKLLSWMNIDSRGLLFGLDHVRPICNKIMSI
ncbi:MAG: Abi family protein [Bacteroidales bacterium]|nr:Abi family protein [Bacteroidales bacterium]